MARLRATLSTVGLVGMIGAVALGGYWYATVRLPAAAAAMRAERLAVERLLPRATADDHWDGQRDSVNAVLPVVMINGRGAALGLLGIRHD